MRDTRVEDILFTLSGKEQQWKGGMFSDEEYLKECEKVIATYYRKPQLIYVDVDGTICTTNGGYDNAKPIQANIAKVNKLYDEGNIIVYWTARGGNTGKDWSELTGQQLVAWGCKFHDVIMRQKPAFDLLIDDKSKRIEEI